MSYSINSLKVALGIAVLENNKLDKFTKVAVMEFIHNGTDAQIKHLALTGEVKHKFTIEEKKQLNEKCDCSKFEKGIMSQLKEWSKEDVVGHVASGAQKVASAVNKHTGGHGTAAAAIAGGAALAGGAAYMLAKRRAKKKAEMAKKAIKK